MIFRKISSEAPDGPSICAPTLQSISLVGSIALRPEACPLLLGVFSADGLRLHLFVLLNHAR